MIPKGHIDGNLWQLQHSMPRLDKYINAQGTAGQNGPALQGSLHLTTIVVMRTQVRDSTRSYSGQHLVALHVDGFRNMH